MGDQDKPPEIVQFPVMLLAHEVRRLLEFDSSNIEKLDLSDKNVQAQARVCKEVLFHTGLNPDQMASYQDQLERSDLNELKLILVGTVEVNFSAIMQNINFFWALANFLEKTEK